MNTFKINEFASMIGQSKSQLRFYEKYGLFQDNKDENGYRVYTQQDGFRLNAFRNYLQYGFSIKEAIRILDTEYSWDDFAELLERQKSDAETQIRGLQFRIERLNIVLKYLKEQAFDDYQVKDLDDYLYYVAAFDNDYSVSIINQKEIATFVELLPITSYVRILHWENLLDDTKRLITDYAIGIIESDLPKSALQLDKKPKRAYMGKCLTYYRRASREEDFQKEMYSDVLTWLSNHGYHIRGNLLIFPQFLDLNGSKTDIEAVVIPIE